MNKITVVRKGASKRLTIRFLFFASVCSATAVTLIWSPSIQSFLLFLPAIISLFIMLLYYESYKITLTASRITITFLFIYRKSYSYNQIIDVYFANSYTNHEHLCVTFSNKKSIQIFMDDINAKKARRIIQSHHSIRILKW